VSPPAQAIFDGEQYINREKIACLLCRRTFPKLDTLEKHIKMSDLHKVINFLTLKQIFEMTLKVCGIERYIEHIHYFGPEAYFVQSVALRNFKKWGLLCSIPPKIIFSVLVFSKFFI
jgi:hypothetical protein